jgi:hypothetical protein
MIVIAVIITINNNNNNNNNNKMLWLDQNIIPVIHITVILLNYSL